MCMWMGTSNSEPVVSGDLLIVCLICDIVLWLVR